jgi:glycerol-3-phosphate cytidylyltransferase
MGSNKPKIVYTSGSWDLFHVGHLNILERSKAQGDVLVVGVSTDKLIENYKGIPPIIPYEERFQIIKSIGCVDMAVKQEVLTEIAQLKELNIDVVTIGDDWKDKHLDGLEWMKSQPDKEVVYFEYTPGVSTTGIKRKIIQNIYDIISAELRREIEHMEAWKLRSASEDNN